MPMRSPGRAERWLARLEDAAIAALVAGLVLVLALQVASRFLLAQPLHMTEELSRVCFVWLTFLGAARATPLAQHFVMDVVVNSLPPAAWRAAARLVDAVSIVFLGVMAWVGWTAALKGAGQIMPALGVSILLQSAAFPVGFMLMTLHAVLLAARGGHVAGEEPPRC